MDARIGTPTAIHPAVVFPPPTGVGGLHAVVHMSSTQSSAKAECLVLIAYLFMSSPKIVIQTRTEEAANAWFTRLTNKGRKSPRGDSEGPGSRAAYPNPAIEKQEQLRQAIHSWPNCGCQSIEPCDWFFDHRFFLAPVESLEYLPNSLS
jgi:hypothetical protein